MNRHGLALRDMEPNQRDLAFKLMSTGLTDRSYEQARQIIALENVLGPLEKERGVKSFKRDPELYYFTILFIVLVGICATRATLISARVFTTR